MRWLHRATDACGVVIGIRSALVSSRIHRRFFRHYTIESTASLPHVLIDVTLEGTTAGLCFAPHGAYMPQILPNTLRPSLVYSCRFTTRLSKIHPSSRNLQDSFPPFHLGFPFSGSSRSDTALQLRCDPQRPQRPESSSGSFEEFSVRVEEL